MNTRAEIHGASRAQLRARLYTGLAIGGGAGLVLGLIAGWLWL
jgi:hypothetical protein